MAYLFEIHLTVDNLIKERLSSFEKFCQTLGGQAVLIELPVGERTQQPMLTMTKTGENIAEVLAFIDDLKLRFVAEDFSIIRTKFEIPAHQANEFLSQYPDTNGYFEWHGKVWFQHNNALQTLRRLAGDFQAHLSKNALKDSTHYRFITYRTKENLTAFFSHVESITTALTAINSQPYWFRHDVKLEKSQHEYCVYDSNLAVDDGWDGVFKANNLFAVYQTAYPHLIGIGGESYDLLEEFCLYEALIRRSAQVNQPFMLKGSYVTRQYFDNPHDRMPVDVDFVCLTPLPDIATAHQVLTDWLTTVTRYQTDDGVYFVDFSENAFWRMIDYAMHDDFPTVQTDIECYLNGKKYELWVEVSFNLDIPFEPIPLLYKTPIDEFVYPKTVSLALQIAWKIHQCLVRPRLKDIYDLTYLTKKVDSPKIVEATLEALLQECQKDHISRETITNFFDYKIEKIFNLSTLKATWKQQTHYSDWLDKWHFPLRPNDMDEFFAQFQHNMQQAGFTLDNLSLDNYLLASQGQEVQSSILFNQVSQQHLNPPTMTIYDPQQPLNALQMIPKIDKPTSNNSTKMRFIIILVVLIFILIWVFIELKLNTP